MLGGGQAPVVPPLGTTGPPMGSAASKSQLSALGSGQVLLQGSNAPSQSAALQGPHGPYRAASQNSQGEAPRLPSPNSRPRLPRPGPEVPLGLGQGAAEGLCSAPLPPSGDFFLSSERCGCSPHPGPHRCSVRRTLRGWAGPPWGRAQAAGAPHTPPSNSSQPPGEAGPCPGSTSSGLHVGAAFAAPRPPQCTPHLGCLASPGARGPDSEDPRVVAQAHATCGSPDLRPHLEGLPATAPCPWGHHLRGCTTCLTRAKGSSQGSGREVDRPEEGSGLLTRQERLQEALPGLHSPHAVGAGAGQWGGNPRLQPRGAQLACPLAQGAQSDHCPLLLPGNRDSDQAEPEADKVLRGSQGLEGPQDTGPGQPLVGQLLFPGCPALPEPSTVACSCQTGCFRVVGCTVVSGARVQVCTWRRESGWGE